VSRPDGATDFWATVGLMLRFARRRSRARAKRQRALLGQTGASTDWSGIGAFLAVLFSAGQQLAFALLLYNGLLASQRISAEAGGRMLVTAGSIRTIARIESDARSAAASGDSDQTQTALQAVFQGQGRALNDAQPAAYDAQLLAQYQRKGRAGFVTRRSVWGLAAKHGRMPPLPSVFASLVILAWFATLAFQGEGIDIDLQRRRHPMWEWLLGHPVDSRAVFLGEMLSPLVANAAFWVASIFWIGAFWLAYDDGLLSVGAGIAAGLPLSAAAGCVSKAVEVVALLRLPPRSRGAALGILAWLGQAAFMIALLTGLTPSLLLWLMQLLSHVSGELQVPLFSWLLGMQGTPSIWKGIGICWVTAVVLIACSAQLAARATRRGLAGDFAGAPSTPALLTRPPTTRFWGNPVYRKELLWLWRDRGALVQVFLIPLSITAFQLINLRSVIVRASDAWHSMAGATVVFGSYFLFILGPRSLLSEGAALWIPLTWPRGLDELLLAKARLWWLASLALVYPLLLFTAFRFPLDGWKVGLVALLWAVFGRNLAERGVTLVNVPSDSGEPEPTPRGRTWAASVGTLTFGVGVLSQQWHLALIGVVYSWLTTAAMWQNFRARLPYLFDRWSERLPQPPTLVHAMVAISAMTELTAIVLAAVIAIAGRDHAALATSATYGICGLGVGIFVNRWLSGRGVRLRDVTRWDHAALDVRRVAWTCGIALASGVGLACLALSYSLLLLQSPLFSENVHAASDHLSAQPHARLWLALAAVGFAPLTEEYLFRGLLFRALHREWSSGRAIWGSACFFAIYHPPLAWLPVALVGATSAWLFKRGRHLLPCVLLHMTYNAVLVWAG
jgi:membrane protease YdiL (CAAX protease family)